MNVADLLSTLQKLNQHNENKERPMEVARVDGYTVPLNGSLASPELNFILAFRPPQEPAALERQNLTTLKQKWENGRVQRVKKKEKLKRNTYKPVGRERNAAATSSVMAV